MQLKSRQATKFINDMMALGLIEPTTPFRGEVAFQVATQGLAFANATAAKPIYRATGERVVREFVDRVTTVNASEEYAFRIRSSVVFGSMLSCADRLGDVDVAVDLQPRISDSAKFRQLCDRRRHSAEEQGRVFSIAMDWAMWPKKEVLLQLKARSRSLSLHGFDQLAQMENLCYRVLVGDDALIATQIPTGRAV
jgi:hypothetical protein